MADVRFMQATRTYPGTDAPAVDALDLHIGDGEFMVLVGPSGCGQDDRPAHAGGARRGRCGLEFIGERDITDVAESRTSRWSSRTTRCTRI